MSLVSEGEREASEGARRLALPHSLLDIFDVHMPLIYGEGEDNAFIRL
jgi:hypothetical protein